MSGSRFIIFFILLLSFSHLIAQTTGELVYSGNEQFRKEQLAAAEMQYRKAIQQSAGNVIARYNLGVSLYRRQMQDSSVSEFTALTAPEVNNDIRAKAFFNTGVVYSEQNKLEESIEAYKNGLRINPGDNEARENLQKALLEWKKRNPPKTVEKKNPKQPPPQKPPPPKLNPRQAQQKMKELEDKEKQAQKRMQKKSEAAGNIRRDW